MNDRHGTLNRGSILIVDDSPSTLRALSQILAVEEFQVEAVPSGIRALEAVRANPPDLILLDIMMPAMDGYEVCERLKADEGTRDIPVIFLSALDSMEDKVKAFSTGGVDYITKPFQVQEVLARVESHLALRGMQKQLQEKEKELLAAVEQRTMELVTVNQQLQQEIGERKHAEEAARDSEERFRTLFENAPLCIFEVDLTQTPPVITRASRRTAQVYGWSPQELVSASVDRIVPPDAMPEIVKIVDALRVGETVAVESVNRRQNGSLFPVRVNAATATLTDLSQVILAVEDITLEKARRSEEEAIAEERRRIAREIHDGLAQNLAALRFKVRQWHNLVDGDPPQMHDELDQLREILGDSIIEVRRSIFALRPIDLEKRGLFPALRLFATSFGEHYQVRVNLDIAGSYKRLPASLELTLFRVVQEALNNVGKHAGASAVWIMVDLQSDDIVTVSVRDDGEGFDPAFLDQAVQYGHLGLKQMRERIECVNGTLSVQSQPGRGTEIQMRLPLHDA